MSVQRVVAEGGQRRKQYVHRDNKGSANGAHAPSSCKDARYTLAAAMFPSCAFLPLSRFVFASVHKKADEDHTTLS